MRVALFDPTTSGHHAEYAAYILNHSLRPEDEALYVTPDESERIAVVEQAGAEIRQVGRFSPTGGVKSFYRIFRNVRAGLEAAIDWGADFFHHLFVDTREPVITSALSTGAIPILFTLFNPHYNRMGTVVKRLYGRFCLVSVDIFSKKNAFGGMFIHTPRIKQSILEQSRYLRDHDLHVIPDPVELPVRELTKEDARKKLDIDGTAPVFLFFGGLRADKGPKLLLNAIERVDRDATFVIAGSEGVIGEKEISMTNSRSRATIDARIEFIPDSEIYTYFFASDAVVLPYRPVYYGTSGILQRAAAAGRPVIVTNVGEVGPLAKKHGLGYVVEPEVRALAQQLESFDPEIAKDRFESSLINYAREHSVERFGQEIRDVYVTAIQS